MISKIRKNKKPEEDNNVKMEEEKKLPNNVLLIAQEMKIVKGLASNDLSQRTKQLKKLRRWFTLRSKSSYPLTQEDFLRIWKGLYYMMWMSDKPLVQEQLAEDLGKLIDCFADVKSGVQFFGAFLKTMCREWFGIDQWRMDKFLMLVRRMLRYMFQSLRKDNFSAVGVKEFNTYIFESVLAESSSAGITMHFMDVFFEELAKVSEGELTSKTVGQFIKPFVKFMSQQHDFKILGHCRNRVFHHLLYQSELGREYTEKYNAWKEMGFPTESIDDIEKVDSNTSTEIEEETEAQNNSSKLLDPRAGNVDVFIPLLPLDGKYVIKEIESLLYKEETSIRSRKMLQDILEKYQVYQNGKFPLGVQTMPKPNLKSEKPLIKSKIEALDALENDIYSTSRKLKQLNKRKRKKLLASLNFTEADEDTFEKLIERSIIGTGQNGVKAKKRKSSLPMTWVEEEAELEISPEKIKKTEDPEMQTPKSHKIPTTPKKENLNKIKQLRKKDDQLNKTNNGTEESKDIISKPFEWDEPLKDGEVEYFYPSMKNRVNEANEKFTDLVINPFAKLSHAAVNSPRTPKNTLLGKKEKKLAKSAKMARNPLSSTEAPAKRVKIVLQRNTIQKPSEYIKQIKSSPNVPYDAEKKPTKGLLKPNAMPSPINPFYKKKIGLKLLNETL